MSAPETITGEGISGHWQLDPQRSKIRFQVKLLWGLTTVSGEFTDYRGHLDLGADPSIELEIEAASLQTGNRRRDRHLRSKTFFGVEEYPHVRFVSDSVQPGPDGLTVRGRLSARGHSVVLELEAEVRRRDGELEIEVSTGVDRRELGMTYSPLGMIAPRSELFVNARLVADVSRPAGSLEGVPT
ncbi:MAG TPA: YceI family protein [Solirubrobacteraceae bacterium]|nr:YceI family protein [Solirubrobacteraceae bacterium]